MTENRQQNRGPDWRRLGIGAGLLAAVLGIAAVYWVSKGPPGGAGTAVASADCLDDGAVREAIDAAAQGELAAFRATATGHSYDDLVFLDPAGEATGLTALRGEVVLVNLWATWCAPCRKEMPALAALQTRYGDQGLLVLPINLDIGEDAPVKGRAFLEEIGTESLPFYSDPTFAVFETLRQRAVALGLPTTMLIGPDGCEWGVIGGPAEWDTPDGHNVVEAALRMAGH